MREDLKLSRQFAADMMMNSLENLPFSFEYGGNRIKGIPADWAPEITSETINSDMIRTQIVGLSPNSRMRVTFVLTTYKNHSVCEWLVYFKNVGTQDSKLLEDIRAADFSLPELIGGSPVLWHGIGENHEDKNYSFEYTRLEQGRPMEFSPKGGRPCDNAFPYFRIFAQEGGVSMAVGWPGQWHAKFEKWETSVFVKAGQESTDFYLHPGEQIRTPRITLLFFTGTEERGINLWRDWFREYILPRARYGTPLRPRLCGCARDPKGSEHCNETEYTQLDYIRNAREKGFTFDTWWIDAGWYDCTIPRAEAMSYWTDFPWQKINDNEYKNWPFTGIWKCDEKRFPRGMKPISDEMKKDDVDSELLLWFEPERIQNDENMFKNHPDFLLSCKENPAQKLLNLANPEVVGFLSRYMSAFIKTNGIDVYRQDFNFEPLPYWKAADEDQGEHRDGITENFYVQGYLRYWDYLLADNPGLWIDSCSSGGRRNDLETLRRSTPLHYSDYGYRLYVEKQRYHHVLYQWFMNFKDTGGLPAENAENKDFDLYESFCSLAPMTL